MALQYWNSLGYSNTILDQFGSAIGTAAQTVVSSGNGRGGANSLRVSADGTSNPHGAVAVFVGTPSTVFSAFAYKGSVLPPAAGERVIHQIRDAGSVHVDLRVLSDGSVRVTRNGTSLGLTSPGLIAAATYSHIELKVVIHNSTGTIDLFINGTNRLSLTGQDTQDSANASATEVSYRTGGANSDNSVVNDFCDLIVRDDATSGDARVLYIKPNGAGNSAQWTPSTGANHQTVDETPLDTADYNSESTVGEKDTFATENISTTAAVIAVCTIFNANKQDAGAASVAPVIRHSTTDFDGTNVNPPFGSNQYFRQPYTTNPGTAAAWTASDVNAAEFGYKRTA